MPSKQDVGRAGEDEAITFFLEKGFSLVDRNWHCRLGELDVVVEKDKHLHFVEVKKRTTTFLHPFSAISNLKRLKVARAIDLWRQRHPEWARHSYQVDAFCIWRDHGEDKQEWIKGM